MAPSVLDLNHQICNRRWGKSRLVGGEPPIHDFTARSQRVGDVNGKIRNPMDSLHELKNRNALDDDRARRRDAALDNAIDLIVEMNEMFSRGNEKQISLDQRDVEMPRKIPSERGFAYTEPAIDGNDNPGQVPHQRRQRFDDRWIGSEDFRQGAI
jgi:hypothetical protein